MNNTKELVAFGTFVILTYGNLIYIMLCWSSHSCIYYNF